MIIKEKVCIKCGRKLNINNFTLNKSYKDGYSSICKTCKRIYDEDYRKKNHERLLEYDRKRSQQRKRPIKIKTEKEIDEYNKQRSQYKITWFNQKYRNEPIFKLNICVSSGIRHALKGKKEKQHWENLVNYDVQQLKEHLEKQFTPEMTWSNYGSYWEIDHIIPQNLFNITSPECHDFQICWSLMNLRPLEKSANRSRPKDGSDVSEELKQQILGQNT